MKTKLLLLFTLISLFGYSQTIKGLKSIKFIGDTIVSYKTDTVVFDSIIKINHGVKIKKYFKVYSNGIFNKKILINTDTLDFPLAKLVASQGNSGHTYSHPLGISGEAVSTNTYGMTATGVGGVAATDGQGSARGVVGVGKVLNTADIGTSTGLWGRAVDTHVGGINMGVWSRARNGARNLSWYSDYGTMYQQDTAIFGGVVKAHALAFSATNDTLIGSHNGYLYKVVGSNIDTSTVALLATQNKFTKTQTFNGVNILTKTAGTSDSILVREGNVVKYRLASSIASTGFKWLVTGGGTDKIYTAVQAASAGDVVIVDAGAYTETQNLAKDGVRLHFMNGAVVTKSTAGYLFSYTTGNNNIIITGDGEFITTNGFFELPLTYERSINTIYIEYLKASSSGVNLIQIPSNSDSYTISQLTINGKDYSESTGGRVVYINFNSLFSKIKIIGGKYKSTSSNCFYIGDPTNLGFDLINIDIDEAETTHASLYAVAINSMGDNSAQGYSRIKAKTIKGTNSLHIYILRQQYNAFIIDANMIGSVYLKSLYSSLQNNGASVDYAVYGNISGVLKIGGYDISSTGYEINYGTNIYANIGGLTSDGDNKVVNIYGNIYGTLSLTHTQTWNIFGTYQKVRSGSVGTFTSGVINNYGNFINKGWGGTNTNNTNWTFTLNGTKFNNLGQIYSTNMNRNGAIGSLITLQSGTLINSGLIKNINEHTTADGTCITVTGGSTFVHDGGRLICGVNGASIANASSTLTIKNYNAYFTNITRSGAGTYTETITGGGTEIVDTDVTE